MRTADPFSVPEYGGAPTHVLDWPAMAHVVVRQVLQLERHERVILSANPYFAGAMLDAVRDEIQAVGAIELATILHWTPRLTRRRTPAGTRPVAADARVEDLAMRDLFDRADVFIWLLDPLVRLGRRGPEPPGRERRLDGGW